MFQEDFFERAVPLDNTALKLKLKRQRCQDKTVTNTRKGHEKQHLCCNGLATKWVVKQPMTAM